MLLLPDLAALHCEDAVEEDQEAHQGCWKQHPRVPAQPGKVQADLLSKIPPGVAETQRVRVQHGRNKVVDLIKQLVYDVFTVTLPDEVQWLILVPSPPPGPALVQQVQVVLCSVRPD